MTAKLVNLAAAVALAAATVLSLASLAQAGQGRGLNQKGACAAAFCSLAIF